MRYQLDHSQIGGSLEPRSPMHNPLPTCGADGAPAQAAPRRSRSRACEHGLLICALFRGPLAAAEFIPGLGLSADAIPQASVLWDCNADGCFTNGCAGNAELWTKQSDVFWWDDLDEYESWTNSCDRDYDYDRANPDNITTSVCATRPQRMPAHPCTTSVGRTQQLQ